MFYDRNKKSNQTKVLTPEIGEMVEGRVKERCPDSAAVMDSDLTPPEDYVKPNLVVAKKSNMFVNEKLHAGKIVWVRGSTYTFALKACLKNEWGFEYNDLSQAEDGVQKPFWWSDTTDSVESETDGLITWLEGLGFTVLVHDMDRSDSDSEEDEF